MPFQKFPLETVCGFLCLALLLILLLVYIAYECGLAFKAGFHQGSEIAHRYPYATSVQLDRKDFAVPLADEPKIKALFDKIIGTHRTTCFRPSTKTRQLRHARATTGLGFQTSKSSSATRLFRGTRLASKSSHRACGSRVW